MWITALMIMSAALAVWWLWLGWYTFREHSKQYFSDSTGWYVWLIVTFALTFIVVGAGAMTEADSQREKIELNRDEWVCTDRTQSTTYVQNGKVMSPITVTTCAQYTRKR